MFNCPRTSLMNWSWLFKWRWISLYIHWINHYPVDKYLGNDYPLDRDLSMRGYFLLKSTNSLRKQPTNISWHQHWFHCEMTSEKQLQKFHTSWPDWGPGGDSDWLNLLPIRRTTWFGKWHVISIKFLCSFLRRHFARKPMVTSEIFVSCFLSLPGHQ